MIKNTHVRKISFDYTIKISEKDPGRARFLDKEVSNKGEAN